MLPNDSHILRQSNLDIKTTFGLQPKWSLWQGGLYVKGAEFGVTGLI